MISDFEHLFMYLLAICMSSLDKCLFKLPGSHSSLWSLSDCFIYKWHALNSITSFEIARGWFSNSAIHPTCLEFVSKTELFLFKLSIWLTWNIVQTGQAKQMLNPFPLKDMLLSKELVPYLPPNGDQWGSVLYLFLFCFIYLLCRMAFLKSWGFRHKMI